MPDAVTNQMADQRALLTDTESEILRGERDVKDNYKYSVQSRVRSRIQKKLGEDVGVLREHEPDIFSVVQEIVCVDTQEADSQPEEPPKATVEEEPRGGEPAAVLSESGIEEPLAADSDLPPESEISNDVWSIVNKVSASWDDEPERLEMRRKAAATALQYAVTHDVYLGKSSDVVGDIREKYPVEGQNAETWWRKNVRDVLKAVGTYSNGNHGYAVADLEESYE